jgi:copper chaperone
MEKRVFEVPNISCQHCVMTIKRELSALEGVKSVEARADTREVSVEWGDRVSWQEIEDLLTDINYPPA